MASARCIFRTLGRPTPCWRLVPSLLLIAVIRICRQATVSIPDIFAGERRDVLLELSIPADLAGCRAGLQDR